MRPTTRKKAEDQFSSDQFYSEKLAAVDDWMEKITRTNTYSMNGNIPELDNVHDAWKTMLIDNVNENGNKGTISRGDWHEALASVVPTAGGIMFRETASASPYVYVMVGPTGVGKTTTLAKLAASSGSKEMVSLGQARMGMFIKELISFATNYDVLIFDCAAGIDHNVTAFIAATPQSVIVANPQPTSLMDVYALIKLIHQDDLSSNIGIIVNCADSEAQGQGVVKALNQVAQAYLSKSIDLLGVIKKSDKVSKSIHMRKPLVEAFKNDDVSADIRRIAGRILKKQAGVNSLERLDGDKLLKGLLKV